MDRIPIEFWIEIAQILIIPITVVVLALIFRPFLKTLFTRLKTLESSPFEIEFTKLSEEMGVEVPSNQSRTSVTRERITEGLKEKSKEKLEKLRLVLETEQVNQMIQYHQNSLAQSRISFWFSIGAGSLGFLVIVLGAVLSLIGFQQTTAILTVVSGAVIDAVAALFFTQSNQARRLMTEFFDKLRKDRQFNECLRLCESISDELIQSQLKARLSLFFAGVPAEAVSTLENAPAQSTRDHTQGTKKPANSVESNR